jgi:cation-transporting ATPase E
VLRFTVPAGLIIAAGAFSAYALAWARGIPLTEQRTAATLVMLILSLCVLALLAMPLTWRRIALVVATLAAFVLLFPCLPCAPSTSSSYRTAHSRAPSSSMH